MEVNRKITRRTFQSKRIQKSCEKNLTLFRERLVQLRKERGLTQKEFSEELGFNRSTVAAWERGSRQPDIMQAVNISKYYSVTLDYLFGFVDGKDERRPGVQRPKINIFADKYLRKLYIEMMLKSEQKKDK